LLRHGKAVDHAPDAAGDRERPLADRGRRDGAALGAVLAAGPPVLGMDGVPVPELALCSAAVRTRQTADLVAGAMGGRLPVDAYRTLYGAEPDLVLRYVREVDDEVTSLLVVGHNPTLTYLAWDLLAPGSDGGVDDRVTLEAHGVPTCGLAVLALGVTSWQDVGPEAGTLAGLFRPPY